MSGWKKVEYQYGDRGQIVLSDGPPFDGNPVLIKTNTGVVEAWWADAEWHPAGPPDWIEDADGFCWVCYDDAFQADLDDALYWMEIPEVPK